MSIKLLFFAGLRERLGVEEEVLAVLPEGVSTVGALREWLCARGDQWEDALKAGMAIRAAVNQDLARASTQVSEGDEVAFFPPVTGG